MESNLFGSGEEEDDLILNCSAETEGDEGDDVAGEERAAVVDVGRGGLCDLLLHVRGGAVVFQEASTRH